MNDIGRILDDCKFICVNGAPQTVEHFKHFVSNVKNVIQLRMGSNGAYLFEPRHCPAYKRH